MSTFVFCSTHKSRTVESGLSWSRSIHIWVIRAQLGGATMAPFTTEQMFRHGNQCDGANMAVGCHAGSGLYSGGGSSRPLSALLLMLPVPFASAHVLPDLRDVVSSGTPGHSPSGTEPKSRPAFPAQPPRITLTPQSNMKYSLSMNPAFSRTHLYGGVPPPLLRAAAGRLSRLRLVWFKLLIRHLNDGIFGFV